jgi:hypothetical protein
MRRALRCTLVCLMLWCGAARAAVSLLGTAVTGTSHTVEAGTNRALLIGLCWDFSTPQTLDITNVQYGGQAATEIGEAHTAGTQLYVGLWRVMESGIAAASGSTITYTTSHTEDATRPVAHVSLFVGGVDQSTPQVDSDSAVASNVTTHTTPALTTATNGLGVAVDASGDSGAFTPNNAWIERADFGEDGAPTLTCTLITKATTGSDETPSVTHTVASDQRMVAVTLREAAAAVVRRVLSVP